MNIKVQNDVIDNVSKIESNSDGNGGSKGDREIISRCNRDVDCDSNVDNNILNKRHFDWMNNLINNDLKKISSLQAIHLHECWLN